MKELFHEYGVALLAAGIALLLIRIVFTGVNIGGNSGLLLNLGTEAKIEGRNYEEYEDSSASEDALSSILPKIVYMGEEIRAGERMNMPELFLAKDGQGNKVFAQIKELRDENGTSLLTDYMLNEFCFSKPGIYEVWVKARDKNGGIASKVFFIPVSSMRGGQR